MSKADPLGERPFDVIVWGATGFTGQLVVEYMASRYPATSGIRWAVAGRNRGKLEALLEELRFPDGEPEIVVADSNDPATLTAMSSRTKVVLTTVGPYAKYGSGLVEACIATGTDYCDLCGEVQWMRQMIDKHQAAARASGARLVMSCGFDSIPSDIGVHCLQMRATEQFGNPVPDVHLLVRAMRGSASGGTFASMVNVIVQARSDRSIARVLADPYALNPPDARSGPDGRDQDGARFDSFAQVWTAPFVMASINTRVVRRTNALLGHAYGAAFRYSEVTIVGTGLVGRIRAALVSLSLKAFVLASALRPIREHIVRRLLPDPGQGPSREQRENGFFNMLVIGRNADGQFLKLRVTGDRDPGYGSTSKMLAEAAVCLASGGCQRDGGFWTPASAMANPLRDRLQQNAGLSFEFD